MLHDQPGSNRAAALIAPPDQVSIHPIPVHTKWFRSGWQAPSANKRDGGALAGVAHSDERGGAFAWAGVPLLMPTPQRPTRHDERLT